MSSNFKRPQPAAIGDREQNPIRTPISSRTKSTVKTAGACAVSLFSCAALSPQSAGAKTQHAASHHSAEVPQSHGAAGWISGSETYIRARPGTETPPVAKLSKHTQLHVWGKYNGWYRVETPDHIFGWVYNSYVNVPQIGKLGELSHVEARSASDHNENETMYGSAELLRRHYVAYHAIGAAKGLHQLGITPPVLARPAISSAKHTAKHAIPVVAHPKPAAPRIAVQPVAHHPHRSVPAHMIPTTVSQETDSTFLDKIVKDHTDDGAGEAVKPAATPVAPTTLSVPAPVVAARVSAPKLPPAPVATPTAAATITADDLMKARQEFLAPHGKADKSSNAGTPKVHPTSAPAPHPAAHTAAVPYRGGSPRDRYAMNGDFGQNLASRALTYQGTPYVFGSSSPENGFDCSGFVCYLLRAKGYNPPRTSGDFGSYGTAVPEGHLKPGDILLFANTYRHGISHVGIYIGNNKFVHAANPGKGVCISSLSESYYADHYYGARRVK